MNSSGMVTSAGASAVVLLGAQEGHRREAEQKFLAVPADLPRLYAPAPAALRLRRLEGARVRLRGRTIRNCAAPKWFASPPNASNVRRKHCRRCMISIRPKTAMPRKFRPSWKSCRLRASGSGRSIWSPTANWAPKMALADPIHQPDPQHKQAGERAHCTGGRRPRKVLPAVERVPFQCHHVEHYGIQQGWIVFDSATGPGLAFNKPRPNGW